MHSFPARQETENAPYYIDFTLEEVPSLSLWYPSNKRLYLPDFWYWIKDASLFTCILHNDATRGGPLEDLYTTLCTTPLGWQTYIFIRHFRKLGWFVYSAFGYGMHFQLYTERCDITHGTILVRVVEDTKKLSWSFIQSMHRLACSVRKEILICCVTAPAPVQYDDEEEVLVESLVVLRIGELKKNVTKK